MQFTVVFQIEKAIKNIPNSSRGIVSGYLNIVKNGVKFVSGQELQPIDDSFELMLPTGCKAEQVANYFNDNRIIVNYDIWKHFSNTDQAALIMHESIYASERLFGATSSKIFAARSRISMCPNFSIVVSTAFLMLSLFLISS